MLYGTVSTDLYELFVAIKAQLASATGVSATYVFFTLNADDDIEQYPPCDRFIVIRWTGRLQLVQPVVTGSGTLLTPFSTVFGVTLWNRLYLDQDLRGVDQLGNSATYSLTTPWIKVIGGLQQFDPIRSAGVALTTEPISASDFTFPSKKLPEGWARIDSAWAMKFLHRLS